MGAASRGVCALLQDLALRCLRIPKVHHLVHQFVNDDKVVADRLFFQLLEVFNEHLNKPMQEDDNLGSVGVPFRHGQNFGAMVNQGATGVVGREKWLTIKIGMSDVHVVYALVRETGCELLAFLLHLEAQREKSFDEGGRDIVSVGTLDERLALEIEDCD